MSGQVLEVRVLTETDDPECKEEMKESKVGQARSIHQVSTMGWSSTEMLEH